MIYAYLWWCGDDECDCTQYRVERLTKRPSPSVAYDIESLWEGEFVTLTYELTRPERAELLREFRLAARRFGIKLTRLRRGYSWAGGLAPTSAPKSSKANV